MSHLIDGKVSVSCSLETMRKSLLERFPEWEEYMQSSENGDLEYINFYGGVGGKDASIVIKKGAPGNTYSDTAFVRNPNGTWTSRQDQFNLAEKYRDCGVKVENTAAKNVASDVLTRLGAKEKKIKQNPGGEFILDGVIDLSQLSKMKDRLKS